MAPVKADWTLIEHEIEKAKILGDPMAPLLRVLLEARRDGVTQETLQHLAYEAAAGARTEVRKLVEIEVRRQWPRIAPWVLAAVLVGFLFGWLARSANAAELSCQDPRLLDAVRRDIAERYLDESILHQSWSGGVPNYRSGHPQCFGILGSAGHSAGTFWYGWRTFEGKTYVVWERYRW